MHSLHRDTVQRMASLRNPRSPSQQRAIEAALGKAHGLGQDQGQDRGGHSYPHNNDGGGGGHSPISVGSPSTPTTPSTPPTPMGPLAPLAPAFAPAFAPLGPSQLSQMSTPDLLRKFEARIEQAKGGEGGGEMVL